MNTSNTQHLPVRYYGGGLLGDEAGGVVRKLWKLAVLIPRGINPTPSAGVLTSWRGVEYSLNNVPCAAGRGKRNKIPWTVARTELPAWRPRRRDWLSPENPSFLRRVTLRRRKLVAGGWEVEQRWRPCRSRHRRTSAWCQLAIRHSGAICYPPSVQTPTKSQMNSIPVTGQHWSYYTPIFA